MKTSAHSFRRISSGFTLIEMIGVMAIMAIMAAVVVPNVLRAIDRAAVIAEQQTVHNLGIQIKKYLSDYGSPPATGTWDTQIATYSDVAQSDITANKRLNNRVLLLDPDPAAFQQRAILLSSMHQGMPLPTQANVNTLVKFAALWATQDGTVPSAVSWGGWTAQAADYLVMERVSFRNDYRTIQLQNNGNAFVIPPPGPPTTRWEIWANKMPAAIQFGTLAPGVNISLPVVPGLRVYLYVGPIAVPPPDYTYLVSTSDRMLSFNGTHWSPQ